MYPTFKVKFQLISNLPLSSKALEPWKWHLKYEIEMPVLIYFNEIDLYDFNQTWHLFPYWLYICTDSYWHGHHGFIRFIKEGLIPGWESSNLHIFVRLFEQLLTILSINCLKCVNMLPSVVEWLVTPQPCWMATSYSCNRLHRISRSLTVILIPLHFMSQRDWVAPARTCNWPSCLTHSFCVDEGIAVFFVKLDMTSNISWSTLRL